MARQSPSAAPLVMMLDFSTCKRRLGVGTAGAEGHRQMENIMMVPHLIFGVCGASVNL